MSVAEPAATGLETAAATRLYELHASRVFGYCLRMLGSREDAEDATQTTFMQAFGALRRGVVPVFETAWLLAIAKNVCLARHRARGRRKAVELVRDPHDLANVAVAPEAGDGSLLGLEDALGRLPETQRRAFLLREWQGRPYAEIAAELGVTVPAVEALIFRARRALATELGGGERGRRRAFDVVSLLTALKSFLGSGAALKIAVGVAAVVSAGAVLGGAAEHNRGSAPDRVLVKPTPAASVGSAPAAKPPAGTRSPAPVLRKPPAHRRAPVRPVRKPSDAAQAPSMPATPASSAQKPGPTASPPAASPQPPAPGPTSPALPSVPGVPDPPAVPPLPVEVPAAPTDHLPVDVPDVPEPPQVPDVPDLPKLP